VGERVRVYRRQGGEGGLVSELAEQERDYDCDYYVRQFRTTYAARLASAFAPEDFAVVFADVDQLSLFTPSLESIRTVLTARDDGGPESSDLR